MKPCHFALMAAFLAPVLSGCGPPASSPEMVLDGACNIDGATPSPVKSGNPFEVRGWVFRPGERSVAPSVALRFEGDNGLLYLRFIRPTGDRSDVAAVLGLGETRVAGFAESVDTVGFVPGTYKLSVVQYDRRVSAACPTALTVIVSPT